jgi:hypothetical protein
MDFFTLFELHIVLDVEYICGAYFGKEYTYEISTSLNLENNEI